MMNNRQKIVSSAVIMACSAMSSQTQALPNNAILNFDAGGKICAIGGTAPDNCDYGVTSATGSWFSMDTNGDDTVTESEKTLLSSNAGVAINATQPANGTHAGAPTGIESPGIDDAWTFFGNTGLHQTTSSVAILSDDGVGTVTLDFGGWNVTWNGIDSIPMGGDSANFATDNNIANVTCYADSTKATVADCLNGTFFVLDHNNVHVPLGDASNFGGVGYTAHLEGTILVPQSPTPSAGAFAVGSIAAGATLSSAVDGRISMSDIIANGLTTDSDDAYTYGSGLFDFTITGLANGASVQVELALLAPIPSSPVYRKLTPTGWAFFDTSGSDTVESGLGAAGTCTGVTYTSGLTEGNYCVRLTITDGGSNDYDAVGDGTVTDPGGVASGVQTFVDTRTSSTSGCSLSETPVNPGQRADWWLVAGFLGALAWLRGMRRRSANQG